MKISALIIILGVLFDQLTKYLAKAFLAGTTESVIWIPYLLELGYYENRGASLGILQDAQFLFMIITVIALAIFGYMLLDTDFKQKKVYSIAVPLFIAGTLGNAIDRALLGYVIDFLHYPFLTPILNAVNLSNFYNNLADMYLSLAIVLFAVDLFILEPKRSKKEKKDADTAHSDQN